MSSYKYPTSGSVYFGDPVSTVGSLPSGVDGEIRLVMDTSLLYECSANVWSSITSAGGGDVTGPASSTDDAFARFNGAGGKTLQNSGSSLSDTNLATFADLILSGLTATTVPYLDGSKQFASSAVTPTQLGYLDATSSVQTQIDGKQASGTYGTSADNLSFFAATTSAQLAGVLSDETGTGLAVFGTSPTLISPLLGTPTSGVLTNCTGTAASLTAGAATLAISTSALKSATTTVNVDSATAPTTGQVLTATGPSAATWQAVPAASTTDALESATTTVDVSAATAPTVGQVLTATSSTAATWQDGGGGAAVASWKVLGTSYTILDDDGFTHFEMNVASSLDTLTLPTPANNTGRTITMIKVDNNLGIARLTGGSQNIYGYDRGSLGETYVYVHGNGGSVTAVCDGTSWYVTAETSGSMTGVFASAWTGGSGGTNVTHTQGSINYNGDLITLMMGSGTNTTGTSNTHLKTTVTVGGKYSDNAIYLTPQETVSYPVVVTDNGTVQTTMGLLEIKTDGYIYVYKDATKTATWTDASTCGLTNNGYFTFRRSIGD